MQNQNPGDLTWSAVVVCVSIAGVMLTALVAAILN